MLPKAASCTAYAFATVVDAAVCTHDAANARDLPYSLRERGPSGAKHTCRVDAYHNPARWSR